MVLVRVFGCKVDKKMFRLMFYIILELIKRCIVFIIILFLNLQVWDLQFWFFENRFINGFTSFLQLFIHNGIKKKE